MDRVLELETRVYTCDRCGMDVCECGDGVEFVAWEALEAFVAASGQLLWVNGFDGLEIRPAWSWSDRVELGGAGVVWAYRALRVFRSLPN